MKGKIHPLSVVLGILLIVLGVLAIQVTFSRFEMLVNEFSYMLLNVFLVLSLFGLTFLWVGFGKFESISLTNHLLIRKYWFGLFKKKFLLPEGSSYSVHSKNYLFFEYKVILIENTNQQQLRFSNLNILNFSQFQNYIEENLKKEDIKFRTNQGDKVFMFVHFILFLWLIFSNIFNLTL